MTSRALAAVALLVAAAAAPALGSETPIVVGVPGRAVEREVRRVVDGARAAAVALLGREPASTGTVHLYPTWREWADVEAGLTHGRFATNGAFTAHSTGAAHVALQPALVACDLAEFGLPDLTRRLLAHETAHVVVFAATDRAAHHPDWLAEGFACVVADRALGVDEALAADPIASTRLQRCRRLLHAGRLPRIAEVLDDRLPGLDRDERYAVWWAVACHLAREAPESLRAAFDVADSGARAAADALRDEVDVGSLDNGLVTWLEGTRPQWEEVRRSLQVRDDDFLQAAFDEEAIAWRVPPCASLDARVEIRATGEGGERAGVLVEMNDGLVEIRLTAGFGLSVLRTSALDDPDRALVASHPVRGFDGSKPLRLGIERSGGELVVRLDGRVVTRVAGAPADGRFALVSGPHARVAWRRVRFR